MKNTNKRGFTLIEMLVVVIIIGILAAIALPAYQKSVEQSRAAQIWPLLKSVSNAAQMYYMSRGTYPTTFDSLSILPPSWSDTEQWRFSGQETDTRSNGEWSLQMISYDGSFVVQAGRLKGKYRGAGFRMFVISATYNKMTLLCAEQTRLGIKFEEPEGSYCVDIFDAKPSAPHNSFRLYDMP